MCHYTVLLLGQTPYSATAFTEYDSLREVIPALNDGMRQVSVDIGVTAYDTLTLSDNTYWYSLGTRFIPSQDGQKPALPYNATRISSNGKIITGMKQTPLAEFSTTTGGSGVQIGSPEAVAFSVTGRTLWLYPAGFAGDKVYVTGPLEITGFTHDSAGFVSLPEIYPSDRHAACYWAAAQLAKSRGDDSRASDLLTKYIQHVIARTGRSPALTQGQ